MSENVTIEQGTVNWEEQRTPAKTRSRVWPWVIGIGAGLLACSLLSIALAFGLMGSIVRMIGSAPNTIEVYSDFETPPRTRGFQGERRGGCDCCPCSGQGRGYIEYYYEGDEYTGPGERGGRITIELDEGEGSGVHGRGRTYELDERGMEDEIEIIEGRIIGQP